jgi:hypothetical protein
MLRGCNEATISSYRWLAALDKALKRERMKLDNVIVESRALQPELSSVSDSSIQCQKSVCSFGASCSLDKVNKTKHGISL